MNGMTQEQKNEVRALAAKARALRAEGKYFREIAEIIGKSPSRVREYCLGTRGMNWDRKAGVYRDIA